VWLNKTSGSALFHKKVLFYEFRKVNVFARGTVKVFLIVLSMTCGAMNGVYLHNNADKRNLEIKFRVN